MADETCPACGGSGKVIAHDMPAEGERRKPSRVVTCPLCAGSGKVR